MGADLLLEAVVEGEFDPECTRIETALKAIWLLYRWETNGTANGWNYLEAMGVTKEDYLLLFEVFEEQYGIHRIRTDRQTILFLNYFRRVDPRLAVRLLSAAIWMVGQYLTHRRRMRAAYYGWPDEGETE